MPGAVRTQIHRAPTGPEFFAEARSSRDSQSILYFVIQLNTYDFDSNRFSLVQGKPSCTEIETQNILKVLGASRSTAGMSSESPKSEAGMSPSTDVLRSALGAIPSNVDSETWTRLISAVRDGAPDVHTAEALFKEWSPEIRDGEYAREMDKPSEDETTVSTLFGLAKQHGWKPPETSPNEGGTETNLDSVDDNFTLNDFEAILGSLGSEPSKQEAERLAFDLVEEASVLSDTNLEKALLMLEELGARARKRQRWRSAVRNAKKERKRRRSEIEEMNQGPSDLKAAELTAWIEERILEADDFAVDDGGALFYHMKGRYHHRGEKYLDRRIKKLLHREGLEGEFSEYRCKEVRHSIKTDAPYLWKKPPADRICLQNGILDFDTGEIVPHSPEEWLMTRSLKIRHDPTAQGTAWREFLDSVMPDDAGAEVGFEVIAYLLSRARSRRKALFLYGGPNTGKSTFLDNLVHGIFGETNTRHMSLQKLEKSPFARANLFGRRLNVCADLPSEPLKGMSVFKQITGGDRMHGERKHEQGFEFKPYCHLVFSGNGPIMAPGAGEAFWDRWIVIPFLNNFSKGTASHVPKEKLDEQLRDPEELSALLNEVLPIIHEGRGVTQTPSMKNTLDWMRRVNEEEEADAESLTEFPSHAGDGASQEGGEPRLD